MRDRIRVFVLVSVVTIGVAPLGWAQSGNGWTAPMTPWGEPDLMGVWTSATLTPLERPERFGDKAELTAEDAAAMERQTIETRVANDGKAAPGSVGGYNQVWLDSGTAITGTLRTSLIIEPANGQIPWVDPAARAAYDTEVARYGVGPFHSWTDMDTGERCITDGLPNMVPLQPYNMNLQIFQTPGEVVMLHEMYHELRVIPISDRPLTGIGQWTGEARRRREDHTLVVETVNFADKPDAYWSSPWRKSRSTLKLVERFTRVGPQSIDYTFTMEDPEVFNQPWTAAAPITTDHLSRGVTSGVIYEFACHERNYSMINVLAGARMEELGR